MPTERRDQAARSWGTARRHGKGSLPSRGSDRGDVDPSECRRTYDVVDIDFNRTAIVMELVTGETLSDVVRGAGIAAARTVAIALDLLSALTAFARHGVSRIDPNPSYVIMRKDDAAETIDRPWHPQPPLPKCAVVAGSSSTFAAIRAHSRRAIPPIASRRPKTSQPPRAPRPTRHKPPHRTPDWTGRPHDSVRCAVARANEVRERLPPRHRAIASVDDAWSKVRFDIILAPMEV